ncbi:MULTISPECIES: hypothetical protein [Bifidobacterium]|jgi:hypothetical protein|uniref:hypothetical protein n=1 Tax=Bifidobacterium TaxID=1678 RepID=UPI0023522ABD|nr:hypothetical protein [Bifidobacterium tibiigranuli]MCI1211603.1 hypothetical protein [Bifidobacterium tibiigranuli]MCI1221079.1 hypothetical protein [Bifidobacterium tibiigranuli]MCI1792006.1 hypothetical protein [Bifidobacterium tibiigranuli]MCI1798147.1 hypothetical protein [Bifidobacterium tibiigranuli]
MAVLTFDDVKYSMAENEAHRRGVDLNAEITQLINRYAYDAKVRNDELSDGEEIAGVWKTHDDIRRYFEQKKREAGIE